jgi:glutamate-1-semialdehyde 2,1-aminomutase
VAESILDTYVRTHPGSAALYEESTRIFPSGVTHDTRYVTPFPIYVDRAAGSHKWDVDGNEYIDYVMGHGALLLGHAHPQITDAIVEQAKKGTHYGANHRLEIEWGSLVQEIVPSAQEVRFTSSGTEATLMALRLARAYTGRDRVLKFDQHFHGWHDAVAGPRSPEEESPHSPGVPASVSANTYCVPQGDFAAVEEKLSTGEVAAVIIEPTGASYGTLPLSPRFLQELRDVTKRHNTVLIFDEVVTGFRVAPGGTQARYGVTPDLTTLAKILAGGMPGGCVTGKRDIVSMIEFRDAEWASRRIQHPGTFNANPISAAAGSAMLKIARTGEPHKHADALNQKLIAGLNGVLERTGASGAAYGLASYWHVTLGEDVLRPANGSVEWTGEGPPPRTAPKRIISLKRGMLNHGADLMGGSGGFVSGVHTETDIEQTVRAFEATIGEMQAEGLL